MRLGARIALNPVRSVEGAAIPLEPRSQGQMVGGKTGQAGAATAGGAVVAGPIGLVGGYFVSGQSVKIKAGDKLATEVTAEATRHRASNTRARPAAR